MYSGCWMSAAVSLCHSVMRAGKRRWVNLWGYVVIPSNYPVSHAWSGGLGAGGGSGFGMHRVGYFVPVEYRRLLGHHWVLSKHCHRSCPRGWHLEFSNGLLGLVPAFPEACVW